VPTQAWIHFSRPVGPIRWKPTAEKPPQLSGDCVKEQRQPRKASPILTVSYLCPEGVSRNCNSVSVRKLTSRSVTSLDQVASAGLI
jgi:hypothetical protein